MSLTYVPVVGTFTYRDADATPAYGKKVIFVAVSAAIVDGEVVTLPKKLVATLNGDGEIPAGFGLPTVGDGVYYSVREEFPGGRDAYTIQVLTTDTEIDLATVAPVVPADPLVSYASSADIAAAVAAHVAALDPHPQYAKEADLGTAAAADTGDFASAAQGALADSALQDADIGVSVAAATVTQGKHAVPVMAGAIRPSVTGGCAAIASVAIAASQPDINTLNFDATTQEYAQFAIPMPKSWNESTITAQFHWSHAATTVNFGVVWNLQAVAVSDDDTIAVAFGTAQQVADTGGTTNDLYTTAETPAITVSGTPQAGDTVFFRLSRVTGDASDNMAIDARLHGVTLFITTNADTDL